MHGCGWRDEHSRGRNPENDVPSSVIDESASCKSHSVALSSRAFSTLQTPGVL